ncbi:integrin alpha-9-like isoform X2 [Odontomachus brunneus]|uniref:integrin alpha-9-like isoform X2 n=1 Tax=Odontomachus brunneus TaxID=486640 RepID=UPI0013F275D9|nr:integrin alpha-9-like isoform X2 [Odontomachus brunneus]
MLSATNLAVYSHIRAFVIVLIILRYNPLAYNINSRSVQIFNYPVTASSLRRGSYFGFSVALYAGTDNSLVLVGAPRANSTRLHNVKEPGTVFQCAMNGVCKEWLVDQSVNGVYPRNRRIKQIKDNAWIGATIAVENKTIARVVVCGPRWKMSRYHYIYGICYGTLATNIDAFKREAQQHWLPTYDSPRQIKVSPYIYNYAYSQVGFSLHMNSRNYDVDIALGAPGMFGWEGDAILITNAFNKSTSHTIIASVVGETWLDIHNYFGYAITSGAYFKQGDMLYATGATTGSINLRGKVLVFKSMESINYMKVANAVEGQQIGEYFGAALTSCDINNDGKDELVVGAPQWTKDMDEGCVYIFTTQHSANLKLSTKIEGEIAGGRFGSTLMCLGDVDYDGYGDIAIGAPYEEESGGAVYIYNGNVEGVFKRYSQRLIGSDYSPLMRGFGISISEPRDINGDKYPDIAVGAYLSEKVVLLRTMPVVTLNVTLAYLQKIRLLKNTSSFVIDMQVYYEGAYVPESLRIVKVLKIDQTHGRVSYHEQRSNDGMYRIPDILYKNRNLRSSHEIHFMEEIQNILDPFEIFVSVELEDDLSARNQSDMFCTSCVVINKFRSKTKDLVKLPFAVECGEDEICMSDLSVMLTTDLKSNNRYVIGSSSTIALHIDTRNRGEPAYQAKVHIFIEALSLANIPPKCMENSRTSYILHVVCDIGNPLRTNKNLTLQLDTSMVTYDIKQAVIRANISTHSNESTSSDNSHVTTVHFDVDMDVAIVGKAQVNSYSYSRENKEMPLENVKYQHFYEIQRFGVSPIEEVTLTMRIPTHWQHSTGNIVIANISSVISILDGSPFHCGDFNHNDAPLIDDSTIASLALVTNSSYIASNNTHANFSSGENTLIDVPPANRTLYVNCTNNSVRCKQISCKVGPFPNTLSVAKLLITLDLQVLNFHATLMKDKDIVFYVSEGNVIITQPYNIIQRHGHKPDAAFVATTFVGTPVAERIAMWILALSIALGIILLLLLILGLIKVGFFNRKKKMELEALKAESDKKYNVVLETTSSTEVFDHD